MKGTNIFSRVKKSCMVLALAAGLMLGATTGAQAVDFKAKGEWRIAFGLGNANLHGGKGTQKNDLFGATQRLRLQLDAVASENLSGRVWFEIGFQDWGNNTNGNGGGALGADGVAVAVKNAYLDWIVPETDLKVRMGIQAFSLPNIGGSTIMGSTDVAGITTSYQFNDEVGLTAFWLRPVNDNYRNNLVGDGTKTHYLDNFDLFGVSLPLTFEGYEVTPFIAYGILGRNALRADDARFVDPLTGDITDTKYGTSDGHLQHTLLANVGGHGNVSGFGSDRAYSSVFFGGLPIKVTAFDPLNIEFEFDYGYVEGFGKTDVRNYKDGGYWKRAETSRSGWMLKALVEYKMDWGIPGIMGWYGSGDDGSVKNGSERMPSIKANQKFTSFLGAAGQDFYSGNFKGRFNEKLCSLAGTWGVGLQVRDMEFLEDLKHTFRAVYIGGTNDTSMVKYFKTPNSGITYENGVGYDGPYLTKNDGLIEFNLDNTYKVYENLQVGFDLGYVVNLYDKGTWKHYGSWQGGRQGMSKHDAWKAQLTFNYTF